MDSRLKRSVGLVGMMLPVLIGAVAEAWGQSASMFGDPAQRPPLRVSELSYTFQIAKPTEFKEQDLITVIVDEKSQVISEGEMDRRKKANGSMALSDWIMFDGWALRPDPQTPGDPKVAGQIENKYRAEGELETRDSMKFKISCAVKEIYPNGLLWIEGERLIQNNNEQWALSLCGLVRPEDVLPNNTVLSENIARLRIDKREAGHVRDGYRRGWLLRILDRYQPF